VAGAWTRPGGAHTGLYRAAARWYNPSTGDWTSRDPAQSDADLYRYVDDDPISLQDPSGLAVGGGGSGSTTPGPVTPQQPAPSLGPCGTGGSDSAAWSPFARPPFSSFITSGGAYESWPSEGVQRDARERLAAAEAAAEAAATRIDPGQPRVPQLLRNAAYYRARGDNAEASSWAAAAANEDATGRVMGAQVQAEVQGGIDRRNLIGAQVLANIALFVATEGIGNAAAGGPVLGRAATVVDTAPGGMQSSWVLKLGSSRAGVQAANRALYGRFKAAGGKLLCERGTFEINPLTGRQVLGRVSSVNRTITLYQGSNLGTVSEELIHFGQLQSRGLFGQGIPPYLVPVLEKSAAPVLTEWGYVPVQ